jgi:NADH-quinone oxidoreductase subunit G
MVPKKVQKEVEVDDNRLLSLVGAPDDFEATLEKLLKKKESFSLIVGPDFYTHPNSKNLARLVALFEKYSDFGLVMIPALTNTLGVGLICDLDEETGEYSIGYNTEGDFVLSALGDGDLDMPAINQQEGTLTGINKRVNPTNAAIGYGGYELNDIANALGLEAEYTIDYTQQLPQSGGFKAEKFDDLPNYYTNSGEEVRGYRLSTTPVRTKKDESVEKFDEAARLDGEIVYLVNPVRQFTPFTNKAHQLQAEGGLYVSEARLESGELSEGDRVSVKTDSGEITVKVICDNKIDGNITCLPTFDKQIQSEALFSGYRFSTASIAKV